MALDSLSHIDSLFLPFAQALADKCQDMAAATKTVATPGYTMEKMRRASAQT